MMSLLSFRLLHPRPIFPAIPDFLLVQCSIPLLVHYSIPLISCLQIRFPDLRKLDRTFLEIGPISIRSGHGFMGRMRSGDWDGSWLPTNRGRLLLCLLPSMSRDGGVGGGFDSVALSPLGRVLSQMPGEPMGCNSQARRAQEGLASVLTDSRRDEDLTERGQQARVGGGCGIGCGYGVGVGIFSSGEFARREGTEDNERIRRDFDDPSATGGKRVKVQVGGDVEVGAGED
eukprot:757153-Hanusia_phi.AAC.10